MKNKDNSLLNISTYTNYIVHNSQREVIVLKTEVKLICKVMNANKYAVLTTQRLLLFDNRELYLNKKKPYKHFAIQTHVFQVNSTKFQIQSSANEDKGQTELIFPSSELAIHWWESINQLREGLEATSQIKTIEIANQSMIKNSMINKSNIFSASVIEGINNDDSTSLNIVPEKGRKNSRNGGSSPISSVIFNNGNGTGVKKRNKKKVGFKEDIRKEYIISKGNRDIGDEEDDYELNIHLGSKRHSLETQRDYGETIVNDDDDDNNDSNADYSDNSDSKKNIANVDNKQTDEDNGSHRENKKGVDMIRKRGKDDEESKENDSPSNKDMKLITVNKKSKTFEKNSKERKDNDNDNQDISHWDITPIISSKLESNQRSLLKKENSIIGGSNPLITSKNKHSISSHSKSFSIENSKSCSMLSKDEGNSIKIGFINAFDTRMKKSEMPPTLIYTDKERDSKCIENPEREIGNSTNNTSIKGHSYTNRTNNKYQQRLTNNPSYPIEYHKKTISQYSNIPSKVIPALKVNPQSKTNPQTQTGTNTDTNLIKVNKIADHTTIHIFRNDQSDEDIINNDDDDDNNTHNTPFTSKETNSIVFIEKVYKPSVSSLSSSSSVMKPSQFIEQLLENRYSPIMLRISLKEGSQNSTFITKLYDFLSSILKTYPYSTNQSLLKCLFEKIPSMIRKRLIKNDLLLLPSLPLKGINRSSLESYGNHKKREMKTIIQRDMRTLQMIFANIMKDYPNTDISNADLLTKQQVFNMELNQLIEELN